MAWRPVERLQTGPATPLAAHIASLTVGGTDRVDLNIAALNSHDGTSAFRILLAIYGVRRPTKNVDSAAVNITGTEDQIAQVVNDLAAVPADDGVEFLLDTLTITAWDISTGDPIVPGPEQVTPPRLLGDDIRLAGYRAETTIAEKGVTILQRGIRSTRWRDYVDIVQLFRTYNVDAGVLRDAAEAVAAYRRVSLGPVSPLLVGYGEVAQPKWAAWRRKEGVDDISEELLDDQVALVAEHLDPVFAD